MRMAKLHTNAKSKNVLVPERVSRLRIISCRRTPPQSIEAGAEALPIASTKDSFAGAGFLSLFMGAISRAGLA